MFSLRGFKILPFIYILLILALIFSADSNTFPTWLSWYRRIPYGDKVGHFILFGCFSLSLNYLFQFRQVLVFSKKLFIGSTITIIFVTGEEFSQILFENRTFDLVDLMANFIGILLIGQLLGSFIANRFKGTFVKNTS